MALVFSLKKNGIPFWPYQTQILWPEVSLAGFHPSVYYQVSFRRSE
jgi:hypothetical protein